MSAPQEPSMEITTTLRDTDDGQDKVDKIRLPYHQVAGNNTIMQ